MKFAILYFTGTGVTAKFAYEIAMGISDDNHTADLIRLKRGIEIDLSEYDIIGVGSPAYSFRVPWLVTRILRQLDFQKKPFFVFCTSGGVPGNALWNLYRVVNKTAGVCLGDIDGIGITNLRSWMPKKDSNDTTMWGLGDSTLIEARRFSQRMINNLTEWNANPIKKTSRKWKPIPRYGTIIWSMFFTWRIMMAATVGIKRVDKEKCTKCKVCATKICPSGAIILTKENLPKFNEWKCIGCNGCVNLCPEDAIWTYQVRNHQQYDYYKAGTFLENCQK